MTMLVCELAMLFYSWPAAILSVLQLYPRVLF